MQSHCKITLAILAATAAMALSTATSTAVTITPSVTETYAIFESLTFASGGVEMTCEVTLLMTLETAVAAELPVPAGTKIGLVTHVELANCSIPTGVLESGGARTTSGPVLWSITLREPGTVGNELHFNLNNTRFLITVFGIASCLASGTAAGITNAGNSLTELSVDETVAVPVTGAFCPSEENFAGTATLEPPVTLTLS